MVTLYDEGALVGAVDRSKKGDEVGALDGRLDGALVGA